MLATNVSWERYLLVSTAGIENVSAGYGCGDTFLTCCMQTWRQFVVSITAGQASFSSWYLIFFFFFFLTASNFLGHYLLSNCMVWYLV